MKTYSYRASLFLAGVLWSFGCGQFKGNKEELGSLDFQLLNKIGVINHIVVNESIVNFSSLTSLCVDREGNIYIADSGEHRIYRYNKNKQYISSFGSQGQGPGEFLGTLRLSVGNDDQLYITDDGNRRLSIYSLDGHGPLREVSTNNSIPNLGVANSCGNIYMISSSKSNLIDIFSPQLEILGSILSKSQYMRFSYFMPHQKMLKAMIRRPNIFQIKLLVSAEDLLYVVLNSNQSIIVLNEENIVLREFKVKHPRFIKDYYKKLKAATVEENAWYYPFGTAFFDHEGNICLCYYNSSHRCPEIYRYNKVGIFLDLLVLEGKTVPTNQLISDCDHEGNFYSIDNTKTMIEIYRIK